jgi:hypothetical protein
VSRTGEQPPGNPAAGPDEGKPAGEVPGFDQRRARARLALLEQEVTLAEALKDLEEASARPAPPPGTDDTQAPTRARAERAAAQARHWISKLAPVVGDPESVTDEHGLLPRDRRERFLAEFAATINAETSALAGKLPALRATLAATGGRQQRAPIREEIRQGTARLAYLRALPPFTAGHMCSECPSPMAWHATSVTFCLESGAVLSEPCPSWPVWNAKIATGIARYAEAIREHYAAPAPKPEPAPQPLAVIAAGTSVEDLISRLTQIQAGHPGAQIRRGKKHSWEIWPATAGHTTSKHQA